MNPVAVIDKRYLQLVLAFGARSHHGANAHLRKAGLAGGFFRGNLVGSKFLAVVVNELDFDRNIFVTAVVQKCHLETDFALRGDHVFQFAHEGAARSRDFL